LSNGYYLDLMQPAAQHYAVDPLKGADLTAEQKARVWGGEAAMWEELATEENIEAKLWPRLAAIAERFWSPESVNDVASMYRRLEVIDQWLEIQGMQHRQQIRVMQERLVGDSSPELAMLASILEPLKGYARHRGKKYGSASAFNRLVDSIAPESEAAREFQNLTNGASIRARLILWRDNARSIGPKLAANPLLKEDVEAAAAVEELCSMGLEALDGHPDAGRVQGMLARIDEDSKPEAEMTIAIAPAIRKMVEARAH
jgi:hexosaminidase